MDKYPKSDKPWVADQRWVVREEIRPAGQGGFRMPEGQGTAVRESDPVLAREEAPYDPGLKAAPYPSNPFAIPCPPHPRVPQNSLLRVCPALLPAFSPALAMPLPGSASSLVSTAFTSLWFTCPSTLPSKR